MPSILESLTKVLGQGGTLAKLGSVMGGDAEKASEGVAAAGPALLGALAENAGTDEGAKPIADLVDSVGPSILDDVKGFLDSGETEVGAGVLDALFGDDRRELLGGLSSEGSVSSAAYAKLLPVLTPLVLGAVAKRKADDDLDVNGLAAALADERRSLEDDGNLGEWFGRTLAGGGAIGAVAGVAALAKVRIGSVADKVGDTADDAVEAVGDAVGNVADKVGDMVGALRGRSDDGDDGTGGADERRKRPGWFWWAVGAVILVLLLAFFLSRSSSDDEIVDGTTTTAATTTSSAAAGGSDTNSGDDAANDDAANDDAATADADLAAAVETALADAGFGDSVTVSVSGGVVTLSGVVGSQADIDAIDAAVGAVDGIGEVVDDLTVDGVDDAATADADLAAAVETALADAGFGDSVTVSVSGGVVTLSGVVGSQADVDAIAAALDAVEGLDEVVNDMTFDAGSGSGSGTGALAAGTLLNDELGLAPITFAYRSATITAAGEGVLAEVVAYLEANEVNLVIQGHTDSDGTDAENVALGQRRADAVSAFLVAAGVDQGRLQAVGIGESEPKIANDTADAKAVNRRIELVVAG